MSAELELAVRSLGLGLSTYADGRIVTNAYDADAVERLEELGFRCASHLRFPGRGDSASWWECVYVPPAAEELDELEHAEASS